MVIANANANANVVAVIQAIVTAQLIIKNVAKSCYINKKIKT